MSAPKSILKKRNAPPQAGPSASTSRDQPHKPVKGSKLRQSVTVKRPRVEDEEDDEGEAESKAGDVGDDGDVSMGEEEEEEEVGTDEEIERRKAGGVKKTPTQKRKPATTPSQFGTTLTSLLTEIPTPPSKSKSKTTSQPPEIRFSHVLPSSSKKSKPTPDSATTPTPTPDPAPKSKTKSKPNPTNPILSLSSTKPPPTASKLSLERRAAKLVQVQKAEKEDRARVRDVVEGWMPPPELGIGSGEFEKGLRKTAQRGVIKLFNAILTASKTTEELAGTSLSAGAGLKEEKGKRREKDNILGRGGKEAGLTKEGFLELVRKG